MKEALSLKRSVIPKSSIGFLIAMTAFGLFLGAAAYFDWGRPFLRVLWSPWFLKGVQGLLVLAFLLLLWKWTARKHLPQKWLQGIYGILFLPIVLLPALRCYFKVPYVFCRVCPHPCPWGILRSTAFPAFLLLNLSNRFWCTALCPFGTYQECQTRACAKRFTPPRWLGLSSWMVLLLVTGMYLLTLFGSPWTEFFEEGKYAWAEGTVLAALGILALAFFIPKFFCRCICPVGTIAELTASFRSSKKKE